MYINTIPLKIQAVSYETCFHQSLPPDGFQLSPSVNTDYDCFVKTDCFGLSLPSVLSTGNSERTDKPYGLSYYCPYILTQPFGA